MAREGLPFLVVTGILSVLGFSVCSATGIAPLGYAGWAGVFFFLLFCFFFRDPERLVPAGETAVVSAADGWVTVIRDTEGERDGEPRGVTVSVFLSVFDVHVNRIPYPGRVLSVRRRPGRFLLAFAERASAENEQVALEIESSRGRIIVKQIAGFVARRIVCHASEGVKVDRGDRFGLIKFGSRVDMILPEGTEIRVHVGEHVKAGETIIGVLKT